MIETIRSLKFRVLVHALFLSLATCGLLSAVAARAQTEGAGSDTVDIHLGPGSDGEDDGVIRVGSGSRGGKVDISLGSAHVRVDDGNEGDIVLMGDDIFIEKDEVIDGNVVAIGGSVTILGKVYGDAVAIGGTLTLGDSAYVSGDAVSVAGGFERSRTSRVGGEKVQVGLKLPMPFWKAKTPRQSTFIELMRWIVFYLIVFAFAAVALYLGRDRIAFASEYLGREPFPSFLLGLLSPFLALVAFVLLLITLIGIPVALALIFLYPIFMFLGWVVAGHRVGASVEHGSGGTQVRTVFIGLLVISGLHMLSVLLRGLGVGGFPIFFLLLAGMIISFTSSLVGLGAILGTRFRSRPTPPAPPAAAPPPSSGLPPGTPSPYAPMAPLSPNPPVAPSPPMAAPAPPAPPAAQPPPASEGPADPPPQPTRGPDSP